MSLKSSDRAALDRSGREIEKANRTRLMPVALRLFCNESRTINVPPR
jgi:hypothetical protein